ncbi:MAG: nucleotidyltransferase substrate binding protein [Prevotella sp.]|nr:nucleotidyltransferase substrate binding protein [Prevotella sp.]
MNVNDMDIRWTQRYDNYHKACQRVLEITESDRYFDSLSDLELEGLVQRFEYTFELAWKVLQDLMKYKGYEFVQGPNGTLAQAFEDGMISNHDGWRQMARARIMTAHTYNEDEVREVAHDIYRKYASLLKELDLKLEKEKNNLK